MANAKRWLYPSDAGWIGPLSGPTSPSECANSGHMSSQNEPSRLVLRYNKQTMFFTYVLYSKQDGKLYIGYSSDVMERFDRHSKGLVAATMHRRPLELIYYEAYPTEQEAKRREKFLKGGKGRGQLKAQLELTFKRLHYRFID